MTDTVEEEEHPGWLWDENIQDYVEDPNWQPYENEQQNEQYEQQNEQYDQKYDSTNQSTPITKNNTQPELKTPDDQQQKQIENTIQQPAKNGKIKNTNKRVTPRNAKLKRTKTPPKPATIDERNIPQVQICNQVIRYKSESKLDSLPPGSRSPYISQDLGNATPRHVRMTLYHVPATQDTCNKCNLAFACVVQPLANVGLEEEAIPVVDMGDDGPIRCIGCRAYINAHITWINQRTWKCNLCELNNECPQWYRCNLDGKNRRRDRHKRSELHRGSVDYIAPMTLKKMMQDTIPSLFFVIDVTCIAYQRGLLALTIKSIKSAIHSLREQYTHTLQLNVGFLTYDKHIHFHAISNGALHVITDINHPFVSLPASEILIPLTDEHKYKALQSLLDRIPSIFTDNECIAESEYKSCVGSAMHCASQCLQACGGKVIVIQTALPNTGMGTLHFRNATQIECDLYKTANVFYNELSLFCAEKFICIDLYCCATNYCDIASVGEISRKTGGQIYYYSNFQCDKNGVAFEEDLCNNVLRKTVFRCMLAVRASKGLEPVDYYGNFFVTENQEMQLPVVTSDTTLAVSLQHYQSLIDDECGGGKCSIQIAMLFKDMLGDVFIRVHTVALPVVRKVADVFKCVDMDAVLNVSLKQCAYELISNTSSTMTVAAGRSSLVEACVNILFTYRRYCAQRSIQRQLVLPEALKLLPLFTLGLLKNPLLADNVSADERSFHISYSLHMPVYQSITYIHSYLYPMHNLRDTECVVSDIGRVLLPPTIKLKCDQMLINGLYVMDTGRKIYIIIGPELPPELFEQAFELQISKSGRNRKRSTERIGLRDDFDDDVSNLGYRLSLILDELRYDKPYWLSVEILLLPDLDDHQNVQTIDQLEFLKHLIEDASRNAGSQHKYHERPAQMAYVDFLVYIHKQIHNKFIE